MMLHCMIHHGNVQSKANDLMGLVTDLHVPNLWAKAFSEDVVQIIRMLRPDTKQGVCFDFQVVLSGCKPVQECNTSFMAKHVVIHF